MKIVIISRLKLKEYPPLFMIIKTLLELKINVILCLEDDKENISIIKSKFDSSYLSIRIFPYDKTRKKIKRLINIIENRIKVSNFLNEYMEDSIFWIFGIQTLLWLNNDFLKRSKYILHFLELDRKLPLHKKLPIYLDPQKYVQKAHKIVVCEYNRAFISMDLWKLKYPPCVLPNNSFYNMNLYKNMPITSSNKVKDLMNKIKDKKIIIYQGILSKERPLDAFIQAVEKLGEDYVFLIVGKGEVSYKEKLATNTYYIPFLEPPLHLEITSYAYIGILNYIMDENSEHSSLNALYCAPNKIFEYAMFKLPMIGNDIPGLRYPFNVYNFGKCISNFTVNSICKAIKNIDNNYKEMAENSYDYYRKTDIKKIMMRILDINE